MSLNIDNALRQQGLSSVPKFTYNVGDCLFDSLQLFLDNRYTSTDLCKGTIRHFLTSLEKQEPEAINSYNHELYLEILYELHKVRDRDTYL